MKLFFDFCLIMITTSLVPRPSLWKGLGTRQDYYYILNFLWLPQQHLSHWDPHCRSRQTILVLV